mgnify:CR=1 FL=1
MKDKLENIIIMQKKKRYLFFKMCPAPRSSWVGSWVVWVGSHLDRLSENAKFKKSGVDIKGLMTREFAKIPILGQPVD